jgi:CHASE2 domain-containing sensor protein
LGTLGVALFRPRHMRPVWRMLSWVSLATGALLAGLIAVTAREMVERFGGLGIGVAALLGALGVLVLLATVPFAAWGLSATRRPHGVG